MSLIRRLSLLRRTFASALLLLLSMSLVGQQLECLHADSGTVPSAAGMVDGAHTAHVTHERAEPTVHQHAPANTHAASHTMSHESATGHSGDAPAPHHDPVAPGCAQLMACGLAVTVVGAVTVRTVDVAVHDVPPVGQHLQYSTADLDIELRPPRS